MANPPPPLERNGRWNFGTFYLKAQVFDENTGVGVKPDVYKCPLWTNVVTGLLSPITSSCYVTYIK